MSSSGDSSEDTGKDSGPQYLLLYRVHNRTCILLQYSRRSGLVAYAQDAPYYSYLYLRRIIMIYS